MGQAALVHLGAIFLSWRIAPGYALWSLRQASFVGGRICEVLPRLRSLPY